MKVPPLKVKTTENWCIEFYEYRMKMASQTVKKKKKKTDNKSCWTVKRNTIQLIGT